MASENKKQVSDVESVHPTRFSGGKMSHIFEMDAKTHLYTNTYTSHEAEEALVHGTYYTKIDGSNGLLVWEDGEIKAYRRHDCRGKAKGTPAKHIPLPPGRNPSVVPGHQYFYEEVDRQAKKKAGKLNRSIYDVVSRHYQHLAAELKLRDGFMTVELVGTKFNRTPGVEADVAMILHHEQECMVMNRTFAGVRAWIEAHGTEGLVVEHRGVFWKIRGNLFDAGHRITAAPQKLYQ
jgi:hypothetical protein